MRRRDFLPLIGGAAPVLIGTLVCAETRSVDSLGVCAGNPVARLSKAITTPDRVATDIPDMTHSRCCCRAPPLYRRGQLARPREEKLALAGVAGDGSRALEFRSGLRIPPDLFQQVGSYRWQQVVTLQRAVMHEPRVIRAAATFLASDESRDVTGASLVATEWNRERGLRLCSCPACAGA